MSGRFSITIFVGAMLVVLVALNAASYVRVEREAELEFRPDRSTLNAGASGTRALYEFLAESGARVMRWREPVATLARAPENVRPQTFVIVGHTRLEFEPEEIKSLLAWVEAGGRLVVIDRTPHPSLLENEVWRVSTSDVRLPPRDVRADDVDMLTTGATQLAPVQPTLLTRDVSAVAPSRYASRLLAARKEADESADEQSEEAATSATGEAVVVAEDDGETGNAGEGETAGGETTNGETAGDAPTPSATPSSDASPDVREDYMLPKQTPPSDAPVVHFADERGALLVDFARGRGRIVVLSDPFIVANRGINRADNLQLATNVLTAASSGGLIVFDEFHQGRGTTRNEFAAYFAGTPVIAMFAQLLLIAAAVVWTRGRRFARPLPAPRVDRRSKLEFVASMAELQQRARAFDLAIENVYGRTRRALARYGGADVSANFETIAAAVAARSGRRREEIEALMRECEDVIGGAPVTPRQSLALVARLRELERALGIRMRAREIRQARSL
ncbi:MAG TPA: DUF4350 domain-containing protein [Pyrinomonadaceae bacterium]|jgi:hypothetical protein